MSVADKAKSAIDDGADLAEEAIDKTAAKASKITSKVRNTAIDSIDDGQDALENALTCTKDLVRAHPITSLAVVGAIAYLWGRLR